MFLGNQYSAAFAMTNMKIKLDIPSDLRQLIPCRTSIAAIKFATMQVHRNNKQQTLNKMAKATTSPAPSGVATAAKPGAKAKAEATPNPELVKIIESYDGKVEEAESFFIKWVECVQENQLDRDTVVVSMMKARGVTYETAQSQYSRMKKLLNDENVLQELKEGKITLKAARERTKTEQKNPKAAKPEAKEVKYNNTLKAFVTAAKESGYSRQEILLGVTAELKSAGIN